MPYINGQWKSEVDPSSAEGQQLIAQGRKNMAAQPMPGVYTPTKPPPSTAETHGTPGKGWLVNGIQTANPLEQAGIQKDQTMDFARRSQDIASGAWIDNNLNAGAGPRKDVGGGPGQRGSSFTTPMKDGAPPSFRTAAGAAPPPLDQLMAPGGTGAPPLSPASGYPGASSPPEPPPALNPSTIPNQVSSAPLAAPTPGGLTQAPAPGARPGPPDINSLLGGEIKGPQFAAGALKNFMRPEDTPDAYDAAGLQLNDELQKKIFPKVNAQVEQWAASHGFDMNSGVTQGVMGKLMNEQLSELGTKRMQLAQQSAQEQTGAMRNFQQYGLQRDQFLLANQADMQKMAYQYEQQGYDRERASQLARADMERQFELQSAGKSQDYAQDVNKFLLANKADMDKLSFQYQQQGYASDKAHQLARSDMEREFELSQAGKAGTAGTENWLAQQEQQRKEDFLRKGGALRDYEQFKQGIETQDWRQKMLEEANIKSFASMGEWQAAGGGDWTTLIPNLPPEYAQIVHGGASSGMLKKLFADMAAEMEG